MSANGFQGGIVGGGFGNGVNGGVKTVSKGTKSVSIKGGGKGGQTKNSQVGKGSKGYQIKGSKGNTSKGYQKVGGIFNRNGRSEGSGDQSSRMRMQPMTMALRPPTTTSATISHEGTIIFRSANGADDDTDELKTKFTGTLIGYRPIT